MPGDEADTHARFLDTTIAGVRIVNIYLPNGNPPGSNNFEYKLAWMDRLINEMAAWKKKNAAVIIGGDFNVIPAPLGIIWPFSTGNASRHVSGFMVRRTLRPDQEFPCIHSAS